MEDSKSKCGDGTNSSNSSNATNKLKRRSLVWNFFQKISRERVQCLLCQHEQNYQGTTGNILRHLKARHALDATIKGQRDPQNQVIIKELMSITTSTAPSKDYERKPTIVSKVSASDNSDAGDSYTNNDNEKVFI